MSDEARPRYLAVRLPFTGKIDSLSVGITVAEFQGEYARLGWSRDADRGDRTLNKGSWQLDWGTRNGVVSRLTFTDRRYTSIPR